MCSGSKGGVNAEGRWRPKREMRSRTQPGPSSPPVSRSFPHGTQQHQRPNKNDSPYDSFSQTPVFVSHDLILDKSPRPGPNIVHHTQHAVIHHIHHHTTAVDRRLQLCEWPPLTPFSEASRRCCLQHASGADYKDVLPQTSAPARMMTTVKTEGFK